MKKLFETLEYLLLGAILLYICCALSGCSALKMITAPFVPSVSNVPSQINKTNRIVKCDGDIVLDDVGRVITCTNGFYSKESGYSEVERKLTLWEKIKQHIFKFFGIYLIGMGLLLLFVPSIFWFILQKQGKAFVQVIKGIQKARKENVDLNTALATTTDEETKKEIAKIKQEQGIK